jgi:hypothetical protein
LTDKYGPALMIWSDVQRAIGERMIVEEHGKVLCMGYATFCDHCDTTQRLRPGTTVSRTSFTAGPRTLACTMRSTSFAILSKP